MESCLSPNNYRHNDIVNRILKGETYESIGNSWGLSRERIRQIASLYNVKSLSYKDKPLTKEDINILNILVSKPKLSYAEISKKYNISNYYLHQIAKKTNIEWIRYPIFKRKIQYWDYTIDTDTGCWNWNYGIHKLSGYGRLRVANRIEYAHRYSFQEYIREIKNNETIFHICNNKLCINPAHLKSSASDEIQDLINIQF